MNKPMDQAQPVIDMSVKALYAAAGVTDVLAERLLEYAEAQQEHYKEMRAKRNEQIDHAIEFMKDAPGKVKTLPADLQQQVETLMKELNLNYDEMAVRGENRISELRTHAAAGARKTARKTPAATEDAVDEMVDNVDEVADEVEPDEKPAAKKTPTKKAPAKKAPAKKAAEDDKS